MIDIKKKNGEVRYSVEITDKCVYRKSLSPEEYILLSFESDSIISFENGDFIDTEFGSFKILKLEKPTETANGGFLYEQKFCAGWMEFDNRLVFYNRQSGFEKAWKMTQRPEYFLEIIIDNINSICGGTYTYVIDANLSDMKLVEFDGTNILDALSKVAEAWDTEWWISDNIIHLSRCEFGYPIRLEKDIELANVTPEDSSDSVYATRLYVFGADRNLPQNYRRNNSNDIVVEGVVETRLKLPEGTDFIDARENLAEEDIVEYIITTDDIYPRQIGNISSITAKEYIDTIENEDGSTTEEKWTAFRFTDNNLTFSEKYIIAGKELRIIFQSGKLAGMNFAVTFNPDKLNETDIECQVFEIVRNEDYGMNLPSDDFSPEISDSYILYGYDTSFVADHLVKDAEQELLEFGKTQIKKISRDKTNYNCETNPIRCAGYSYTEGKLQYNEVDVIDLDVGSMVDLVHPVYFPGSSHVGRVFSFEKYLDNKYRCSYIIAEAKGFSRTENIESKIEAVTYQYKQQIASDGGNKVYLIKRKDSTIPTEHNAYSSLRARIEFLCRSVAEYIRTRWTFVKGLTVGYFISGEEGANIEPDGSAEVKSITVRENAEIKGNANVSGNVDAKKVTSGSLITSSVKTRYFNDSMMAIGGGFGLYEDEETGLSKLIVDDIAIRNKMIVTTLEIQELYSVGGQMVLSKADGEIESVTYDATNKQYIINIKDWDKNPQFVEYDLARCSRWDKDNEYYVNYCVPVHSTTETGIIVEAVHFGDTEPKIGDNLVQFGNVYDTSRQAIIIIGVADGKPQIDVYDGISSKIISISNNLKARMGDLGGIVDNGVELSGYGIWTNNLHIGSKIEDTFNSLISPIDASIANINNDVADINKRLDGVVENWFEEGVPTLDNYPANGWITDNDKANHVGDTYTNIEAFIDDESTPDAGKSWRWTYTDTQHTGYHWHPIADSDAVKALLEASKAQETADGKARTFVSTPYPPYDLGDLWVQGASGDILKCVKAKIQGESFANSDWAKASKYTDDTALNEFVNGDFVTYKTEIQKQFDVTNESFTSVYKATTTAVGNILLGTNQGADGWVYQIDSTIKPTISSISEDGINCALFEFNSTGHDHTPGWEFMRYPLRPEKIQYGATYTLSFELKENMTNLNMPLIFLIATPSSTNLLTEKLTSSQVTEEGKWVGFSFTFRATATGSTGSGQYICIHIPAEYRGKIQTLYVRNLMLTPGNQVVPWCKAPEDIVTGQITVLNDNISQISQTANNINLSVTEITENVSNIDNEISNINDDINNIEDDIRSHAILIKENSSKIDQTAEQIRLEVSSVSTALNNTIDNIGQRVETNESKISSLEIGIDVITAEVAQIKSDGTELSSKIEQTAESISLKVKELGITPINYAYSTNIPKVLDTLKNISNQTFVLYDVTGLSAGDVISLSFIIRVKDIIFDSHDGTATSYIAAQFDKNYGYASVRVRLNESNFENITPAGDGYKKLKVESTSITIPQVIYGTDTPITPDVVSQIMLRLDYIDSETRTDINGNITDIGIIEISKLKIEKGNECTAWTSRTQDMYDELIATGLDIENRQIIATADNFTVRNNSGRVTASVDGDGNLTSNALLCREDNANTYAKYTTTINRLKNGWIEIFYPNGNTQFEIGWNGSSMFRFYDEQGALLWEIGSGAQFNVPTGDTTVISPVTYYKCSASNENSAITEIKTENSLPTVTLYKKVTQSSSNGSHSLTNITYYTDKGCTIPAEGFYADGGIPKLTLAENDNSSEYYRNLYQLTNGFIYKTTQITF